jgi:hypothetical protein
MSEVSGLSTERNGFGRSLGEASHGTDRGPFEVDRWTKVDTPSLDFALRNGQKRHNPPYYLSRAPVF